MNVRIFSCTDIVHSTDLRLPIVSSMSTKLAVQMYHRSSYVQLRYYCFSFHEVPFYTGARL